MPKFRFIVNGLIVASNTQPQAVINQRGRTLSRVNKETVFCDLYNPERNKWESYCAFRPDGTVQTIFI